MFRAPFVGVGDRFARVGQAKVYEVVELREVTGQPMHARLVTDKGGEMLLISVAALGDKNLYRKVAR